MMWAIRILVLVSSALVVLVPYPAAAQEVPNPDLAIVSNTASVKNGHVGQQVTLTIVAINNGPDPAPSLDVNAKALQGLQIVKVICFVTSPDGSFCEYSNVQPGQTRTMSVVAEIVSIGSKTASLMACIADQPMSDPNTSNDCATATLKIVGKR
jgi:conserved repeat domain